MAIMQIAPTLSAPLCLGSHGEDVKELQRQLSDARTGQMLSVDGRFGKLTHKAVIEFQRRNSVKADGVVGPVTAKLLKWEYRAGRVMPYVISFEEPPRPAMTPPLAVLVDAIIEGLKPLRSAVEDAILETPTGAPTKNLKRREYANLEWDHFVERLRNLANELPDGNLAIAGLRAAFRTYIDSIHSELKALEFYAKGGYYWRLHPILDSLPVDVIARTMDRVLRGEQLVAIALAQLQIAFQNVKTGLELMPHVDANGQ